MQQMEELNKLTIACLPVVRSCAAFIAEQQNKVTREDIEEKSANSLVSYVDRKAEELLVQGLRTILPEAGYITEESTVEQGRGDLTWIIDPLDGTTNYLYGIPQYAISVALKGFDDQILLGIVHDVARNQSYHAFAGGGAWLDQHPITVTQICSLEQAVVGTGFAYDRNSRRSKPSRVIVEVLARCRDVRRLGSAALDLAFVASGRLDGYYEQDLNTWDVAAGGLLVVEAGGTVTDYDGADQWYTGHHLVAAGRALHPRLLDLIMSS